MQVCAANVAVQIFDRNVSVRFRVVNRLDRFITGWTDNIFFCFLFFFVQSFRFYLHGSIF